MTKEMMRDYPLLPLLSMDDAVRVLRVGCVSALVAAQLTGYSRQAIYRWMREPNSKTNKRSREDVSALAYKVLRAIMAGKLPMDISNKAMLEALSDLSYEKPLASCTVQEIVPTSWLNELNLSDAQDAAATIL